MNKLLINKYQPRNLHDFNLEEGLIKFINKFIDTNNLNILLIGQSGCGKSILINNILLNYYNVPSLNKLSNNILYINSLKEQGISFYRNDVKIFCQSICEIKDKKKTIILDDFDLLNEQNQQIFKIQMDNYISKVNFICSCSNINKIIKSIKSHLINVKLDNINYDYLNKIMDNICNSENILISPSLKTNIIKYSNNSIKLMINNLEKYRILTNGELKNNYNIENINNNLLLEHLSNYYSECFKKNITHAVSILNNIYNDGYSLIDIIDYMYIYLKQENLLDIEIKYLIINILSKYIININNNNEDNMMLHFLTRDIIKII